MIQKSILLVDDEEDIRLVLGVALTDMGYKVLSAQNGKEGLRIFREYRPPVVITDIKMPDIDGVALLKKIKNEDPDTEVVMITGHGDMEVAIQSFQCAAIDFITKPINVDDLEAALERVFEKITARQKLRDYTQSLESLIFEKTSRLADLQKIMGKETGTELRDVVQRFQSLFDDLPCPVVVMDRDLSLTAINKRFRQEYGNAVGSSCYAVLKKTDKPCPDCPAILTMDTGMSQEGEAEIMTAEGQHHEVLVWTAPIRSAGEAPSHVLVMYTEMAQIQKVHDHLSSLGLLIGSISHSIKGMLTGLDGGMYLLDSGLKRDNDEQIEEGLQIVRQMTGRIRNMVLDVLLFSKERDVHKESLAVDVLAEDVVRVVAPLMKEKGIAFDFKCDSSAGCFEADAGLLRTALVNVLENAADACVDDPAKQKHHVEFEASGDPEKVVFHIKDDGRGMDEKTRSMMCKLFFSSKGKKGTGLGLYITNRTVSQHGGEIKVDSEIGRGSHFEITIPRTAGAQELRSLEREAE